MHDTGILLISTNVVAWYGAIVATLGVVVSIYNTMKDRGRIKISWQKGMQIMNAIPPYSENKDYFATHVTNMGRRPIAIGTVAIKYISGETYILSGSIDDQESRVLTEEKPNTVILTEQSMIDFSRLFCIIVYDRAGRKYMKYFYKFPSITRIIFKVKNYGKK